MFVCLKIIEEVGCTFPYAKDSRNKLIIACNTFFPFLYIKLMELLDHGNILVLEITRTNNVTLPGTRTRLCLRITIVLQLLIQKLTASWIKLFGMHVNHRWNYWLDDFLQICNVFSRLISYKENTSSVGRCQGAIAKLKKAWQSQTFHMKTKTPYSSSPNLHLESFCNQLLVQHH